VVEGTLVVSLIKLDLKAADTDFSKSDSTDNCYLPNMNCKDCCSGQDRKLQQSQRRISVQISVVSSRYFTLYCRLLLAITGAIH